MFNQQPQYGQYYEQPSSASNLEFYQGTTQDSQFYASRPSLEGNMVSGGAGPSGGAPNFGGQIQAPQGWLAAFSPAGFEGEPPLLEGMVSGALLGT